MRLLLSTVAVGAMFAASPVYAARCAQFEILGNQGDDKYDPFDSRPLSKSFQIKVTRLDKDVTSVRFLLVDETPSVGGPRLGASGPLSYDIESRQDSSRDVFVTGNEMITSLNGALAGFNKNDVDNLQFQLNVPPRQAVPAGTHSEQLTIRYQCYSGRDPVGSQEEQRSSTTTLELTVRRAMTAYIGGVGQTHGEIDFGTISPTTGNLSRSISVTALSTLPFDVSITSDNTGKLKRNKNETVGIDYSMNYAGVPVTSGDTLICPSTPSPTGRSEDLQVTLDRNSLATLPAAAYADVIIITFEPRDNGSATSCRKRT